MINFINLDTLKKNRNSFPLMQDTLRIGSPTHVSRCKRSLSPNHPKQSGLQESADFWNSAGNLRAVTSGRVSGRTAVLTEHESGH